MIAFMTMSAVIRLADWLWPITREALQSLLIIRAVPSDSFRIALMAASSKIGYETEKENLAELVKLRNEMRKEELMEAVIKSKHSYAEIMAFVKGEAED